MNVKEGGKRRLEKKGEGEDDRGKRSDSERRGKVSTHFLLSAARSPEGLA